MRSPRSLLGGALLALLLGAPPARAARKVVGPIENVPSLTALTTRDWAAFRAGGAFAIGVLGPRAAPAAGLLVERLADPDRAVRREAARALVEIGGASVEPLRPKLRSENPRVQVRAAIVLGALGRRAAPALPDLEQAVEDDDPRVRMAAFRALRRIRARRR